MDWEREIIYRGRPLDDYHAHIVEECVRAGADVIAKHRCCTDLADKIAAALRGLKEKP